ncbi:hypothetical protein GX51_04833 [Blastomyces parvus]|uniref:Transcription factor domain-containing protein n=1 Tax=Blastomyces parvus TaxID=2060905 RepID=A0A2B7WZT1_9EURO|nr:hypothetical protein GX51_04833 [Blastomyces parvus]
MGKAIATGTGQGDGSDISAPTADSNRLRASGAPRATPSAPQHVPPSAAARSAPSKPQGGPKSFEFVLVTDTESRKQVRRHAMRQYMRQRRLDGIARLESSRAQVRSWNAGNTSASGTPISPASSRIEPLDEGEKAVDIKNSPNDWCRDSVSLTERAIPKREDAEDMTNDTDEYMSTFLQEIHSSHLNVVPSSGRMDPFNCYPLKLARTDQNLIHHFVTTYPMMMYKMGDAYQDNPIKGIFHHLTLHDPVPFQAMLAISSKHLAGAAGQNESVQSLTHKMRALRLLNERLRSDLDGKHDGTIYAAATMAVIEKWSKDPTVERMHHQGIRQIVRRRGGMRGVRATNPFLESVLYWVDFSSAPRAIVGASLPWTGDIPDTVPSSLPYLSPEFHIPLTPLHHSMGTDPEEISSALLACEEFLTFFRSLDELQHSLTTSAALLSQSLHDQGQDFQRPRLNLFDPSTPLYSILTTLPDYDHGIRDVRFIDEYTCMACLFYLNIALYDYYFTSRNFDHYLEWVTRELRSINPHSTPSISSLLWVFLGHGGYMASEPTDKGERSWFVSRMLRVAKKLEWKRHGTSWDNLRNTLLGFLTTHEECGIGKDQITEAETLARQNRPGLRWDEDEIRRDILGPLYTGTPVFSMAPNPDNMNTTLLPLTTPNYVPSTLKL